MSPFRVTKVEVIPLRPDRGFVGIAAVTLNDGLHLGCLSCYTRPDGSRIRVVYPERKLSNGTSVPVYHPLNHDVTELIEDAVNREFQAVFAELVDNDATTTKGERDHEQVPST